eukprot:6188930-Pleurochrysis_carterae.AAC.2
MTRGLGPYCEVGTLFAKKLVVDEIHVRGDDLNKIEKGSKGSIFWLKYRVDFQATSVATAAGSSALTFTVASSPGLANGDTIYIRKIDVSSIGGVPSTALIDVPHVVSSVDNNNRKFAITASMAATSSAAANVVDARLYCDVYRWTDVSSLSVSWNRSTAEPDTEYENVAVA